MIDDHLCDGDYVVIQRQEVARDGQIVAVRDDDGEATLKRLFRERNRVRLEPANKAMKPIYRDRVDIQLVGEHGLVDDLPDRGGVGQQRPGVPRGRWGTPAEVNGGRRRW